MDGATLLATFSEDFSDVNNQNVVFDGRFPKYDNEIAIAAKYAGEKGLEIGDEIAITAEGKEAKYQQTFRTALSTIIWITLPVAIVAFFARGYVVSFIKNGGDPLISSVLAALIVSIFANSVFHIASRGFYAHQDTKTPFRVSILSVGLTILLAIIFSIIGCGVDGLGWAQSIGAMLEVIILLRLLQKRSGGKLLNRDFWKNTRRIVFATCVTGCVAYSLAKFFPFMASDDSIFMVFPKFFVITAGSFVTYLLAGYFLDVEQVKPITERIRKSLFKTPKS